MVTSSGVWTILNGVKTASILGTPAGRQFVPVSFFELALNSASASGLKGTSPGLRSAAMFLLYLVPSGSQRPDKSGLPSFVRGAGAERLGVLLPGEFGH